MARLEEWKFGKSGEIGFRFWGHGVEGERETCISYIFHRKSSSARTKKKKGNCGESEGGGDSETKKAD